MPEQEEKPKEKPQEQKKEEKKREEKQPEQKQEKKVRHETSIVRLAGKDISGTKTISNALLDIKGIGHTMANALSLSISSMHGISTDTELGSLTDEQMSKIEAVLKDPMSAKIPNFILNRRKDIDTGMDMHVVGTDLIVKTRQDIDSDIKNQTWRGMRHRYGQKVRGQKTRSTGRTGATVGVTKKAFEAAAKPAPKGAPGAAAAAAPSAAPAAAGAAPAAKEAPKEAAKPEAK